MISTAFQGVFVLGSCLGSTYLSNARTYFMAGNVAISLVGVVMIRELDATLPWSRFFGFCLSLAYTANIPLILSMSSSNIGGFTKKTTVNAMVSSSNYMACSDSRSPFIIRYSSRTVQATSLVLSSSLTTKRRDTRLLFSQ